MQNHSGCKWRLALRWISDDGKAHIAGVNGRWQEQPRHGVGRSSRPFNAHLQQGHGTDKAYVEYTGFPGSRYADKDWTSADGKEGKVEYHILPRDGKYTEAVEWVVLLTLAEGKAIAPEHMEPDDKVQILDGKIVQITPTTDGRKTIPENGLQLTIHWKKPAA